MAETGGTRGWATFNCQLAASILREAGAMTTQISGEVIPSDTSGTLALATRQAAGVVFSMTLVALSLAASQFGPRLIRNFMNDRTNQVVLGTFVATFLYCLLVLRTIRRPDESDFVPYLAVTFGLLMALGSLGVLIYFIHHVAISIQADEIVARVEAELRDRRAGIEESSVRRRELPRVWPKPGSSGLTANFWRLPSASPIASTVGRWMTSMVCYLGTRWRRGERTTWSTARR